MLRMLIAAILIVMGHLYATRADETDFESTADAQELTVLWTGFCLDRFPSDVPVNVYAASQGAKPMSLEEVKRYLPQHPGRGWYLHTRLGLYAIIIEKSPTMTCAVRRMACSTWSAAWRCSWPVRSPVPCGTRSAHRRPSMRVRPSAYLPWDC